MDNPYEVHSWSKWYREEALREARVRNLDRSNRASSGAQASGARVSRIRVGVLWLLGRTKLVE